MNAPLKSDEDNDFSEIELRIAIMLSDDIIIAGKDVWGDDMLKSDRYATKFMFFKQLYGVI